MLDLLKYLFTTILSVITGTIVYVITKYLIDGLIKQKRLFSEISHFLIYYAYAFGGPVKIELSEEASNCFRRLASDLISSLNDIPFYKRLKFLIHERDIIEASNKLMGISNEIMAFHTTKGIKDIKDTSKAIRNDVDDLIKLLKIK